MGNVKANILYVDDEKENLDGFEASFYNMYNLSLADNGKSGLEILRTKEIHVIVSDQRMPEMSGLEFFAEVQKKYPDIVCIILTAHIDSESAIRAVNQGGIFRYILKPWDKNEMQMSLENAVQTFKLKSENRSLVLELQKKNKELEEHKNNLQKLVEEKTEELKLKNIELAKINLMKDQFFSSILSLSKDK